MNGGEGLSDDAASRLVAAAFGCDPRLVPCLSELVVGIDALGSFPEAIAESVIASGVSCDARVLDLGCGKGAVAITLARQVGCAVRGVDAHLPFIAEATEIATAAGVGDRCRFELGEIESELATTRSHDAVVLAAVGAGLLGGYSECVKRLDGAVARGGLVVVNDGFLRQANRTGRCGYEYYGSHDRTLARLTANGHRLVHETIIGDEELQRANRETLRRQRCNAERLATARPELSGLLAAHLEAEAEECEFIEGETREAVWVLRSAMR